MGNPKKKSKSDCTSRNKSTVESPLQNPLLRIIRNVLVSDIESGKEFGKRFARDRWFTVEGRASVYQLRDKPPAFVFLKSYPQLPPILPDLGYPENFSAIFYSTFLRGGDYAGAKGKAYDESQRFTVELFGAFLDPLAPFDEQMFQKRGYRLPVIWSESNESVVVLRTRVYLLDPTELLISPTKPISESTPWFPYLESRWNLRGDFVLLGGLDVARHSSSMLKQFYDHARNILNKEPIKYGRPEMNVLKFYEDTLRVHHRLWIRDGSPPGRKQVALEMGLALPTFNSRWKKTEARWEGIPPPLELMKTR